MYGGACLHTCVCTTCKKCLQGPEQGTGSPGTGVADSCELPWRCWDSNLGPLESAPNCWVSPTLLKIKHPNTTYSKYKLNTNLHAKESRETFRAFAFCNQVNMFLEDFVDTVKTLYFRTHSSLELEPECFRKLPSTTRCDGMHTSGWLLCAQNQPCSEGSCNAGKPLPEGTSQVQSCVHRGNCTFRHLWLLPHCSWLAHSVMCLRHRVKITTHRAVQNSAV